MFVPSLAWQNDHLYVKTDQKYRFLTFQLSAVTKPILLKQRSWFLSAFPSYVCPEPVLAKRSGLHQKWTTKRRKFLTAHNHSMATLSRGNRL